MPGAKKFHARAFRQLYDYVTYKIEVEDIEVTQVDPAYTSKRCSKCGTMLDENRRSQTKFCCKKCGYGVNTAKNTGFRLLRAETLALYGGRHVTLP
jgi:transposase